ncbi:MAG: phosphoribosylglycinamide formyltransferase [Actinomycetaceae bacterium]|nr:phosphoribosylglycinamide formyltransferase [Actinomycetaceae bacterium]
MSSAYTPPIPGGRIVILVSGAGSNMVDLVRAAENPEWGGQIVAVGADRECAGIDWAKDHGLPTFIHPLNKGANRDEWDRELAYIVGQYSPDLVVCAGYLKLLGSAFLERFGGRTLNTHNSLLPAFPGTHAPADAIEAGVKVAGATLFIVDAGVDTGVILAQTVVPVLDDDNADTLLDRIKEAERAQLVASVGRLLREGWTVDGRRGKIGK